MEAGLASALMAAGSHDDVSDTVMCGVQEYLALSPRSAGLALKAAEEAHEGIVWAKKHGFTDHQVEEFRQFLSLVQNRFIDHAEIKNSKKIGEGSFGTIFKAAYNGQPVAVKRIIKDASGAKSNPQRMREVLLEVSVNLKMEHPNVVKFLGTAAHFPSTDSSSKSASTSSDGGLFLGMIFEFCDKGTIHSRIFEYKGSKLLPEAKLRICKEVASGIKYLHSQNIVHRDLSDHNVLICSDGAVKIADFGCARKMIGNTYMPSTISGSPAFMAPEQLAGQDLSLKLDVWALGTLMWEIFAEKVPWADCGRPTMGMAGLDVMKGIICKQGKSLAQIQPAKLPSGFEPQVQALINKFCTRKVDQRPSASEAHAALSTIWDGLKAAAAAKLGGAQQQAEAAAAHAHAVGQGGEPVRQLEKRLEAFYLEHNPEKLTTVPLMAKQYKSNVADLNSKLRDRYRADLDSSVATSPAPKIEAAPASSSRQQQHASSAGGHVRSQPAAPASRPEEVKFQPELPPREKTIGLLHLSGQGQQQQQQQQAHNQQPSRMTLCTTCPHRTAASAPNGFHEVLLCGGVKFRGEVCNGVCTTGEVVLIDNTTFTVGYPPPAGKDGNVAGLVTDLTAARASLRQALADGEAESLRNRSLESQLQALRLQLEAAQHGKGTPYIASHDVVPLGVRN